MESFAVFAIVVSYAVPLLIGRVLLRNARELGRLDASIEAGEARSAYLADLLDLADKRGGAEYVTASEFLDLWQTHMEPAE